MTNLPAICVDEIEIVPSDITWPIQFERERRSLLEILAQPSPLCIEHFGSTAVPGLDAKPVIDILLLVGSLDAAREYWPAMLDPLGYVFWDENPAQDRLFFVKGLPPSAPRRTHHLHVGEPGSELASRTVFRDRLRSDNQLRDEYAALKYRMSSLYKSDREAYTAAKGSFVQRVMNKLSMD